MTAPSHMTRAPEAPVFTKTRIPIYKAVMGAPEAKAASDALGNGWLGMGHLVGEFESAIETAVNAGSRRAVAVSTGHAALHLALLIAEVGPGDEVIVPSLAHLADLQAILAVGAHPVFVDVDERTLCIDPGDISRLVGPATKAVLPIDYGCNLVDYARIRAIAEEHELRVVHDAAHAFGSRSELGRVGSYSDLCVFSFDPVKALSCVDAGVLMVRTEEELRQARELRVLGSTQCSEVTYSNDRVWHYDAVSLGFRYHLSNLHAAIGLEQLQRLNDIADARSSACRRYARRLAGIDGLIAPQPDVTGLNPFLYYVRVVEGRRDEFRSRLEHLGIDTGIHWTPAHQMTLFSLCRRSELNVTERVAGEIVSLPLHSDMTDNVVDEVCDAIVSFFR